MQYSHNVDSLSMEIQEYKNIIKEQYGKDAEYQKTIEELRENEKTLSNEAEHLRARVKGLEKAFNEQNEYIDDIKSVEASRTTAKAEELMTKFGNFLNTDEEQDELKTLKVQFSEAKDSNLKLRDQINDLKNEIDQLKQTKGKF